MDIPIVFKHRDFVLVDKPFGLSFHRDNDEPGLAQLVNEQIGPLWPVHRLDKMTSGLVLFATSAEAAAHFQVLFKEHKIAKFYLALAYGKPKKKQGEVKGDMQKTRVGSWKLTFSQNNPARTRFYSQALGDGLRAYLLRPYSGRTHQLRVVMKSLGVPILGDERYKGERADRGYLDAFALQFNWHKEHIEYCRYPHQGALFIDSQKALTDWQSPWLQPFPDA
ncbi:TIGR01621 family pseudouridine synthase [Celerinatantimonas sp. MCCC 1A17872]|uniref:TIGR01621 family pseudouridine synthase n=1 Tax=Celerinatantimonas sp. MCCC 1A17872 TaxID=3177514 RepID=UPI0038C102A0